MHDEHNDGQGPALTALRRRLADGMARCRWNQTELAAGACLGRTTVSEALSPKKPVPSLDTVTAMARALKLSVPELRAMQRAAAEEAGTVVTRGPGRAIRECEPHDLEVHPAGPGAAAPALAAPAKPPLPGYVRREHDQVLANAVRDAEAGRSRIVVLVGDSSTGKTRACWEAVQPLSDRGWLLWHPFDPTRARAALEDLHRVGPRTVVWLNEAQHYLGDREVGEEIAAAVHHLLVSPEYGPVLILGTLWPEYARKYMLRPAPGQADPHSRVRELLAGRTLTVPEAFNAQNLATAAALAEGGDRLLGDALTRTRTTGRVTQDLAGAPVLLNCYRHASPAAKALLEAAMDARRLGVGLHLPQAFLTDAAYDYLTDTNYDQLTDDWAEKAYAELAEPVQAPLRRTTPRPPRRPLTPAPAAARRTEAPPTVGPQLRLADYLEQHGRAARNQLCPPASFWHAAHTHLTSPSDLNNLAQAAMHRHRLQWAHHLRVRAADYGDTEVLRDLAGLREEVRDREGAETLAQRAADHGDTRALWELAGRRERAGDRQGAEELLRRAADHGNARALHDLMRSRERAGDRESAETLALQAADRDSIGGLLYSLAGLREEGGDWESAKALAQRAADYGDTRALLSMAWRRENAGDRKGAEALARRAADYGDTRALQDLAVRREEAGDWEGAEGVLRLAADFGNTEALRDLAVRRERAGDRDGAEELLRRAADHGNTEALCDLAVRREVAGDWEGAEDLLRRAADHGNTRALLHMALRREEAGDRKGAEALARQAADRGNTDALYGLAMRWEEAGDRESAETLAHQAADRGDCSALRLLADSRDAAGDREGLETLARQAADRGNRRDLYMPVSEEEGPDRLYGITRLEVLCDRLWPDGLDPDGTPTSPWEGEVPARLLG
ncbi:hypothetical protein [Streptomyces sp. CB03911]|uniref:hypothetical protein n=1 Tax=Streptomyces sp. CB03911 TaxID=1804758 RepID=UPI00256FA695|nr:hypothetical protein [Streptomyces sp. CB03911]